MKELKLSITALSDLVLIQSSNTEGYIKYLDFIPGSTLLGIVARHWEELAKSCDPYELFFSGKVRFLDGHLGVDGFRCMPMPLSFHYPKGDRFLTFNYHLLTREDYEKHIQLQQRRNNYIVPKDRYFQEVRVKQSYRQKSARDYEKGRSKDMQMFGYRSILKGQKFYAKILVDEQVIDPKVIEDIVIGTHRIGKSKSAEYAMVKIDLADFNDQDSDIKNQKIHYIYAMSRIALYDQNGVPTLDPVYLHPDLTHENVAYEKSSIRSSSYAPFNRTRKMYDAERAIIEKGSVIVLQDLKEEVLCQIAQGVGGFRSEGFGEVIVNPSFLLEKEVDFCPVKREKIERKKDEQRGEAKSLTARFLAKRQEDLKSKTKMIQDVDTFVVANKDLFRGITPAQWGSIRAIAKRYKEEVEEKVMEYVSSGSKRWEEKQRETLKDFLKNHDYKAVILLATEMAKAAKEER